MKTRVEIQIENRDKGRLKQAGMSRLWHSCARFCCSHKTESTRNLAQTVNSSWTPEPQRHNDVAVDGLKILSGGVRSWVCPGPSTGWWSWDPHPSIQGVTKVKDWLADCVLRADQAMEAAGFYNKAHQAFEDLGLLGTTGMFIDGSGEDPISFVPLSPTEFCFTLSYDGKVASVQVTYHKRADELVEKFGREAVPECVRNDVDNRRPENTHEIIHATYTRTPEERTRTLDPNDPAGMPYGSLWIHVGKKHEMLEEAYHEMPFVIPRWNVPNGTDMLYGVSPAMDALASARGVNLMDMIAATQVEVALNPRIKAPPGTGPIDLSPGGITPIATTGDGPTEWLTDSRGSAINAENFIARKEAQILRAFHADLFEKLAPIAQKREMTNGLVDALERESLARISPAMGRVTQEFIGPAMQRIFMILYRKGLFEQAPDEAFYVDSVGQRFLIFPRVAQTSRMSQALNSRKVWAFRAAMERVLPLAQIKPEVLDIYNFDNIYRDLDRSDGMPIEWHLDEEQAAQLREARAQAQAQQQAAAMALELATKQPQLAMQAAEAGTQAA